MDVPKFQTPDHLKESLLLGFVVFILFFVCDDLIPEGNNHLLIPVFPITDDFLPSVGFNDTFDILLP